jgi:hypothetical protein
MIELPRMGSRHPAANKYCLGTYEMAAENGAFGDCFRRPQPRRFRLLRQALTVSSLHVQAGS